MPALDVAAPPAAEIYRRLGYPRGGGPGDALRLRIAALADEAAASLEPRGVFAIHRVTGRTRVRLEVAGTTIRGQVGRFLGPVERIAVVVGTAGAGISALAGRYAGEGDALAALVCDSVGSWAAEAAADAVGERVRTYVREGEAMTLRYSPGYCGMAMSQQRVLFGLVDAAPAGVRLLPSLLMDPLKSVSGIVGIGAAGALEAVSDRSPCETCGLVDCHMRR